MPRFVGQDQAGNLLYEREDGTVFPVPRGVAEGFGLNPEGVFSAPADPQIPAQPEPLPQPQPVMDFAPDDVSEPVMNFPPDVVSATPPDPQIPAQPEPLPQPKDEITFTPEEDLAIQRGEIPGAEGEISFSPAEDVAIAEEAERRRVGQEVARRATPAAAEADIVQAQEGELEHRRRAAEHQKTAALDESAAVADHFEDATKIAERRRRDLQSYVENRTEVAENARNEIVQANQAIEDFETDPMRIFKGGTWKKAVGVIGAFLGGMLLPSLGTNPFMDTLDKMIERDIRSQEQELAKLQTSRRHKVNMLGQLEQQFKDKVVARNMLANAEYAQIEKELKAKLEESKSDRVRAQYEAALATIQQRRGELVRDAQNRWVNISQIEFDQRYKSNLYDLKVAQMKAKAAGSGAPEEDDRFVISGNTLTAGNPEDPVDPEATHFLVPKEGGGFERTRQVVFGEDMDQAAKKELRKAMTSGQMVSNAVATMGRWGEATNGFDRNLLNDLSKAIGTQQFRRIHLQLQSAMIAGNPSEKEQTLIKEFIGTEPGKFFTLLADNEKRAVLMSFLESTKQDVVNKVSTIGGGVKPVIIGEPIPLPREGFDKASTNTPIFRARELAKDLASAGTDPTTRQGRTLSPDIPSPGREVDRGVFDNEALQVAERFLEVAGQSPEAKEEIYRIGQTAILGKAEALREELNQLGDSPEDQDRARAIRNTLSRLGLLLKRVREGGVSLRQKREAVKRARDQAAKSSRKAAPPPRGPRAGEQLY